MPNEFDGILVTAIVSASLKIAEKIGDEVDRSLLISYIDNLHKGIRQRDEVVKILISHIKTIEPKEEK
ncbi:MAG: hypothetical protein ACOX2F_07315 [bacterium]